MSWRDSLGKVAFRGSDGTSRQLIGAQFRGVSFYVENAEATGGRRTVKHEYPLRDDPFVEDMGRRARCFPVEGYVLGDGYVAARNALIEALEQPGPGQLLHPYYGTRNVIAGSFRVRESTANGGLARFSIEFDETPAQPAAPSAVTAAADQAASSADTAQQAVSDEFAANFSVTSMARQALASAAAVVNEASAKLYGTLLPLVQATQDLATLQHDLQGLELDARNLVMTPSRVLDRLNAVLGALGVSTSARAVEALLTVAQYVPSVARPTVATLTRRKEQANYDALLAVIRGLAVVQAARIAVVVTYDSYDTAVSLRDRVTSAIDTQAEVAGDTAYAAYVQLRADLVRAVPGADQDLPRLMAYTPAITLPSLVLAHRLYGDLSREADVIARNGIVRPGFVTGGRSLEVLSA